MVFVGIILILCGAIFLYLEFKELREKYDVTKLWEKLSFLIGNDQLGGLGIVSMLLGFVIIVLHLTE